MRYGRYGMSHWMLRLGLGAVFLWIGIDILRHPDMWLGYVPPGLPGGLSRETTLKFNGVLDIALGLLLFGGKLPRLTALVAALHLIAILVTQGINAVIIRDVGLLGVALALLTWPHHRRRHRFAQYLPFRRRQPEFEE
jgi:hypothetical protein